MHGMTAQEYVESHRDQNGRFDPSELLAPPGTQTRHVPDYKQDAPGVLMINWNDAKFTGVRNKLLKEHNPPFTFEEKTGHYQCNSARGEEPEIASLLPTWGGRRLLTKRKHNPGTSVLEKEIPEPQDKGKSPHKDPPEGNMIIRDKSVEESDEILLTDVYLEADDGRYCATEDTNEDDNPPASRSG